MSENFIKNYLVKQVEDAEKREAFEEQIKQQLRTEERFVNYFKQFDPESVESFIEYYAQEKAGWFENVKNYWHLKENKESKWYRGAIQIINSIGRKKVYNQMCLWMNKEASFEDIEIACDWDYWLDNPLYFKDAEPITHAEVDAYIQYIESLSEDDEFSIYDSLTHYTPLLIKMDMEAEDCDEEDDDDDDYGNWYRYYDKVFNTEHVLHVSLERYEKQEYYLRFKDNLQKEKHPPVEEVPYKAPIYFEYETQLALRERYVKEFETYENKMAYEGLQWSNQKSVFTEWVDSTLFALQEIKEYVAVTPNDDWRTGLNNAQEMFQLRKISEAIPSAYEEYLYLLEHQLSFEDWLPRKDTKNEENDVIIEMKAHILEARKLLNEPENFDF